MHCEQSLGCHHIAPRNLIAARRLADLNHIEMPPELDRVIRTALEFAFHAHRPDGRIPAVSDSDSHSYLDVLEAGHALYADPRLLWAASQGRQGTPPRETAKAFPHGGYFTLRSGWGESEPLIRIPAKTSVNTRSASDSPSKWLAGPAGSSRDRSRKTKSD